MSGDSTGEIRGEEPCEDKRSSDAEPTYRQVGVRLKWAQYSELRHAARIYGLAPTTLARALINRGTRAILDEYRREGLLRPPPQPPQPPPPPRSGSGA